MFPYYDNNILNYNKLVRAGVSQGRDNTGDMHANTRGIILYLETEHKQVYYLVTPQVIPSIKLYNISHATKMIDFYLSLIFHIDITTTSCQKVIHGFTNSQSL